MIAAQERSFVRASRAAPCPICSKPDWCSFTDDGALAVCMRVPSQRPAKNGGHVHLLDDDSASSFRMPPRREPERPRLSTTDLEQIAAAATRTIAPANRRWLAGHLGVTERALVDLGVGWHRTDKGGAFAFPQRRPDGAIVGLRLRSRSGAKWALTGSRAGLIFAPTSPLRGVGPLLIVEGESDTAALLPDYDVVGRPGCTQCVDYCRELGRGRLCVVVADHDGAGLLGARALVRALRPVARDVLAVLPPAGNDVREWVRAGGKVDDFDALIRRRGRPALRDGPLPVGLSPDEEEDLAVREMREDEALVNAWEAIVR